MQAMHPDPAVYDCSSLNDLCLLMSRLGGADTEAVADEVEGVAVLRDPQYHHHDIITALIVEVRRLRARLAVP